MVVNQGDLFWIDLGEPAKSEPSYRRPHVVIQNNLFNVSRINTVAVCALTSNLKRAHSPGNVFIRKGEGNIPKDSVINVTQIWTVDKSDLTDKIGTLSFKRVLQINQGLELLFRPREVPFE